MSDTYDLLIDYLSHLNHIEFCGGFLTACFLAWIGFRIISWILEQWAKVLKFFEPSKLPVTKNGPSGADNLVGCGEGILTLIVGGLIVTVLALIIAFLMA